MGGRYLVTGVQLGILKTAANRSEDKLSAVAYDLIDEILEKQFVGNSEHNVEKDAEVLNANWEE